MQITHILRSFFTPIALIHHELGDYYRKDFKEVGVFLFGVFFGMFGIAFIVIVWSLLQMIFHVTNYEFITGLSIILSAGTLYFVMYVFYSHQQKSLFSQEAIKGRRILSSLQKATMPEKIYLIKDYIDQVNVLRSFGLFGYQAISKNTEVKLDGLMVEAHTFISGLSFGGVENQEYFELFVDMKNSTCDHGFIDSMEFGANETSRMSVLRAESVREQMNHICVSYIVSELILHFAGLLLLASIFVTIVRSQNLVIVLLLILVFVFVVTIRIYLGLFGRYSKGYIQKQKDSITGAFTGLSLSLKAFLTSKDSAIMLIKSEQGVQGIEPVMVSKIAKIIAYIMKYWNQYQYNIDHIHELLSDRRRYFLKPRNPYKFVQDIINEERLRGEKDLMEFQSILKSWMTTHMKDLQNYQQEIHQIHQSLSQNNSENAEVIDLLEKNFTLHLQSMQKVQNSI